MKSIVYVFSTGLVIFHMNFLLGCTPCISFSTNKSGLMWELFNFRYAALAPLYYRGAAAAVVVYDITSPESFKKAQYWVKVNYAKPLSSYVLWIGFVVISFSAGFVYVLKTLL